MTPDQVREFLRQQIRQQQAQNDSRWGDDHAWRAQQDFVNRQWEFMQSRYPRPEPKPVHPCAFTPDLATVTSAVSLTKHADGVWR